MECVWRGVWDRLLDGVSEVRERVSPGWSEDRRLRNAGVPYPGQASERGWKVGIMMWSRIRSWGLRSIGVTTLMVVGGVARCGVCFLVWGVLFLVVLFCVDINVTDSSEWTIDGLWLMDAL